MPGLPLAGVFAQLLRGPESVALRRAEHSVNFVVLWYLCHRCWRLGLRKSFLALLSLALKGGKMLPGVAGVIDQQVRNELRAIEAEVHGEGDAEANVALPKDGWAAEAVLDNQRALLEQGSEGFRTNLKMGGIYYRNSELSKLQAGSWALHSSTNTLYPAVFPSVRKYEAEVVSMVLALVHGHEAGAVGLFTSGGTESVLLAMLAYRNQGRARGIAAPEVLCGISAHPAVYKACEYFGLRLTKLPIEEGSFRLRAETVRRAVSRDTVAIYASAPNFTFGVVDAIEELGALAQEKGIGLHVDNCLGGFLLSFLSRAGLFTRLWDFAVPGVTSMSIDVHKYGFSAKGASVVGFRSAELRSCTYVPTSDGCEGLYVTPTLQGSRSGANIAVAWATMMSMGESGYAAAAAQIHGVLQRVMREVTAIPELAIIVEAECACVSMGAAPGSSVNIYQLAGLMEQRGWSVFTGQHPALMFLCVGEQTTDVLIDSWLADLKSCLEYIREHPEDRKVHGNAAIYGAASSTPPELLDQVMRGFVDINLEVKCRKASV